jgi:hypothetical protein
MDRRQCLDIPGILGLLRLCLPCAAQVFCLCGSGH